MASATADRELSSPASDKSFDFMAASLDPLLNDFTHTMSSQSLIYNDSSFLNSPKPDNAALQQPISAFTTSPPPALSSYSALSSLTPFKASVFTSQDSDPADNQTTSPKTPITSKAFPLSPGIKSTPNFPGGSPLFALNNSPFRMLIASDTALPPLLDSGSSPVVRRSQGDITPVFGRGGEIIHVSKRRKRCRETFHDHSGINTYSMELSPEGHSPSLRKRTTPFLQRLSRCGGSLSPSTEINPSPCLASPFMLKVDSTQAASVEKTSPINCTPSASQATSAADTGLQFNPKCAERNFFGMGSSPLSEVSSVGPSRSPIPFDLQSIFEEEDRMHRMKTRSRTRSAGRFLQSTSNPPALGKSTCQAQKRKCIFQDDSGSNAIPPNFGSFAYGSFPVKRRKAGGGHESLTGHTAAPSQTKNRMMGLVTDSSTNRRTAGDQPVRRQVLPDHIFDLGKADTDPFPTSPPGSLTSGLQRTFPSTIPINSTFPMFYRQFPIPSYFYPESGYTSVLSDEATKPSPIAQLNEPRNAYDLYTPRFTRGIGKTKLGLCPICFESIQRGGSDRAEWLAMKVSAYKCYHMQYAHGISPATGLPFSPPIAFRTVSRPPLEVRKQERSQILQGKCHKCNKWAAVEGVKVGEVKVRELFWWKHAASCHKASTIVGERDIHSRDEVFFRLQRYERRVKSALERGVESATIEGV